MSTDYLLVLIPATHQATAVEALRAIADQRRRAGSRAAAELFADDPKDPRSASVVLARDFMAAAHHLDEVAEAIASAAAPTVPITDPDHPAWEAADSGPDLPTYTCPGCGGTFDKLISYLDEGPALCADCQRIRHAAAQPATDPEQPEPDPPAPAPTEPTKPPRGKRGGRQPRPTAVEAAATADNAKDRVSEAEATRRAREVIDQVLGPTPVSTDLDDDDAALDALVEETMAEPSPLDTSQAAAVLARRQAEMDGTE